MKGPWRVLSVQGSLHIFHFLWPDPNKNNSWLYFCILCNKKWDQGTLGTQRSTLIGSRTRLGPSKDPAMGLQYTKHGPLYIGSIFAFYATKMGSRDSGDTKDHPHWVKDPPWSFNGLCHGPSIRQTWPFIYCLDFCILCNKNGIKGL